MDEMEAIEKWCPILQESCIGYGCMMGRWVFNSNNERTEDGYCGLAGGKV